MTEVISRNKVVSSLWWKMLERFFTQGVNLVVQIVLARLLLPEDFGSLAIIVAITNYAALFVQSGLGTAIIQKDKLEKGDVETLLTASLSTALLFYILLFFLSTWIASFYNAPNLIWPLRIQALVLFLNAINAIQTALLSRDMNFKTLFFRSVIAIPVAGAVGIIMAYNGFGLWALVALNLTNMLVVVIVMAVGVKMPMRLGFNYNSAKQLYSFSGKILLANLISGGGDTVRTMVIGKNYSRADLSYYDKAYTYSNYVTHIVISTIQSVILPVFSRSQNDIDTLRNMSRRSIRVTSFIMFPVLFWVAAASQPLVLILLTEKWAPCIPFLMLFCFLRINGCISSIDKQVYYALGRSDIGMYYELFFLIANIAVLYFTVKIGIMAIALGYLTLEVIGTIILFFVSSRVFNYSLTERFRDLIRPFFNSGVVFLACWVLYYFHLSNIITLLLQGITGLIVYLIMVKTTKDPNATYIRGLVLKTIRK